MCSPITKSFEEASEGSLWYTVEILTSRFAHKIQRSKGSTKLDYIIAD